MTIAPDYDMDRAKKDGSELHAAPEWMLITGKRFKPKPATDAAKLRKADDDGIHKHEVDRDPERIHPL